MDRRRFYRRCCCRGILYFLTSVQLESDCGEIDRRPALRKPEPGPRQRLLCRRHPGRDPDALIQNRGFEGDLAHIHPALQERARKLA